MTSARILLIEDECDLVRTITDMLSAQGYEVEASTSGELGIEAILRRPFDLVILDLMLPGIDGLKVCKELRRKGVDTPIMMLTARGELSLKVTGLKAGADDYVTKPFQPEELLARVESLLRRTLRFADSGESSYESHGVLFDFENSRVVREGIQHELSERECRMLRYLIQRRGRVVTRDELLQHVWDYNASITRTVDVHIFGLRQKIEADPRSPRLIITVHGLGYRFND